MTQEEKARAYDEALKRARFYHGNCPSEPERKKLEGMFPVLSDSEDEKARKWLLVYAIEMIAGLESDISLSTYDGIKGHDPEAEAELAQWQKARAYLEKQKEPQNKSMAHEDSSWSGILTPPLCKDKNLDDIAQEYVEGVKEYNPTPDWNLVHTAVCYGYHLAEQEEQKPNFDTHWENGSMVCEQKEQKPAEWSEEDEEMINTLVDYVEYPSCWNLKCPREKLVAFIKSLPKRFSPQPKKEWSEEDQKIYDDIMSALEKSLNANRCYFTSDGVKFLKSLRPQPKRKWTLSDEKLLGDVMVAVELDKFFNDEYQKKIVSWLRSLRPYPQSHWKPSEEQMEALKCAIADVARFSKRGGRQVELENEPYYSALHSLYCNLEKLM